MDPNFDNVILETIYDHLSTRGKWRWEARSQQMAWAGDIFQWRTYEIWSRLALRALTDEREGLLVPAKGKEREAIARVADLYRRVVDGDNPTDAELEEAKTRTSGARRIIHLPRSWKLYLCLAAAIAAAGFAIWRSFPVVKGDALFAVLVAWAAFKKAQVPILASGLRLSAAFCAVCALQDRFIPDEVVQEGGHWSDEEWMARTLRTMADASVAGTIESFQRGRLRGPSDWDSENLTELKREYWNWLSEALLQVLRDLNANPPEDVVAMDDDLLN